MQKRIPNFKSDEEADAFLDQDLSDYLDPENFTAVTFEFAPKDKKITLRLSNDLYDAVRAAAKEKGVNYQKLIREALEHFLRSRAA